MQNKSVIKDFYDLDAWKEAQKLTVLSYKVTKDFPKDERFGIIDQIRRAASSVTANIAEGFGRYHYADKIRFYYQSRGSVKEVQNFILLAFELDYINENIKNELWKLCESSARLINGLIRSAEKQK
jgi:four helix bundle protein